jgi:hypothetical protein
MSRLPLPRVRRQAIPRLRGLLQLQTADSEERYLRAALQFVDDDQFESAYGRSQGSRVPHVIRALELGGGGHQTEKLIARTLPNWGSCPGPSLWASKVVKLASVCGAMPNWFASAAGG